MKTKIRLVLAALCAILMSSCFTVYGPNGRPLARFDGGGGGHGGLSRGHSGPGYGGSGYRGPGGGGGHNVSNGPGSSQHHRDKWNCTNTREGEVWTLNGRRVSADQVPPRIKEKHWERIGGRDRGDGRGFPEHRPDYRRERSDDYGDHDDRDYRDNRDSRERRDPYYPSEREMRHTGAGGGTRDYVPTVRGPMWDSHRRGDW